MRKRRPTPALAFSLRNRSILIESLFCVLPLVDTLNGLYVDAPVGIVFKAGLCMVLIIQTLQTGRMTKNGVIVLLTSTSFILTSMVLNIALGGKLGNISFPIKLIFNILLFVFFLELKRQGVLSGRSFYSILDRSAWLFLLCYYIPLILGIGRRVYIGDIGYKAFFLAQNELGLIIVVLTFFQSYKLSNHIKALDLVKFALLMLCGILLNTKTALISCLLAAALWAFPLIIHAKWRTKILVLGIIVVGIFLLRKTVVSSVQRVIVRFSILTTRYYGDSMFAGVLSGRNYFVLKAAHELKSSNTLIKIVIGNGFCSKILTEMDFVDIFFYLGVIGESMTVAGVSWLFHKCKENVKADRTKVRIASLIVIYVLMFAAGHVLFMSMSGCYFVLYCCFLMYYTPCSLRKSTITTMSY